MQLTALKKRLQVDNDSEDRKLIRSVLDIINPPANPAHIEKEASKRSNKDIQSQEQPKIVLHIDDDLDDREMVNEAIKSIDPSFIVCEAENGVAGIEFLNKAKLSGDLPCLIILDINMPGMDGFETYEQIKKDDALKALPIIIFTTTDFFKGGQRKGKEELPIYIKPDKTKDFIAAIRKILTHCKS